MDKDFQLKCPECGSDYAVNELMPGNVPACKCGAAVSAAGQLVFFCANCGLESEPESAPINEPVPCPECSRPMPVIRQIHHSPPEPPAAANRKLSPETISLAGVPVKPKLPLPKATAVFPDRTISISEQTRAEISAGNEYTLKGIPKKSFGKYKIVREIARGGMGIVYQIHDPELRRDLALKVMLQGEGATEISIKRFLREARAAANLKHSGIITVHEMGQIDGQYYFTMDLIDGHSFQEIFRDDKSMREQDFVKAMSDACSALQIAHDNGIIHRDLKPANIMLESISKRVVVMDFGLAKDNSSMSIQSITGAVFGSPSYMSPEQALGMTHNIDARSDIYGMGIILYEGLTGTKPFHGETALETLSLVVNTDAIPPHTIAPGSVSKDMENIILKCIEKDPERRYQHIYELKADLDAYLRGDQVSARPIPWFMRAGRKIKRRPALLGMLAVSPLIIVAGVAVWMIFGGPSYLEVAGDAIKSGDPTRQGGAVKDLTERLLKQQIKKPEQRLKAFKLFTQCYFSANTETALAAINASTKFNDELAIPQLLKAAADSTRPDKIRIAALTAAGIIETAQKTYNQDYAKTLLAIADNPANPIPVRQDAIRTMKDFNSSALLGAILAIAENHQLPAPLRAAAVETLGEKMSIINPLMKNMLNLYADDSPEVARAAANALAKIRQGEALFGIYGMKAAGKAFGHIAEIKAKEAERNREMMELINDSPTERKVKELSPLEAILIKLNSGEPETRAAAAYDLQILGDTKAVPELIKLISDKDNNLRRIAARSIIALAAQSPPPNLQPVQELLRSKDSLIREHAAYIIGELRDRNALPALLQAADNEESQRVQLEYIRALTRIADPAALPALETICRRNLENRPALATTAIESMEKFGKPAVPYMARQFDNNPPPAIRDFIIQQLKDITGEDFGADKQKWLNWLSKSQPNK
jgi:HEAT repeat protein/DNA-directed RNA polymerase subunit RPC12/RpoP